EQTPYIASGKHIVFDPARRGEDAPIHDIEFCAANSPDVVMADIDEILRLRAEVERLGNEGDWLAGLIAEHHHIHGRWGGGLRPDGWNSVHDTREDAAASWRAEARKAVEEGTCPKI
ncbi:MAG: hypothetical protein K2O70_07120, partial [Desulfovibrionaceae bacterium]|nr:hypothetical protein [Desulfovibrionaceae bacterium]